MSMTSNMHHHTNKNTYEKFNQPKTSISFVGSSVNLFLLESRFLCKTSNMATVKAKLRALSVKSKVITQFYQEICDHMALPINKCQN